MVSEMEAMYCLIDTKVPTESQISNMTLHVDLSDGTSIERSNPTFSENEFETGYGTGHGTYFVSFEHEGEQYGETHIVVSTEDNERNNPAGIYIAFTYITGGNYSVEAVGGWIKYPAEAS
jgi:hypothetical protein